MRSLLYRKKEGKIKCGKYQGVLLVTYAGKELLQGVVRRPRDCCKVKRLFPEEQRTFGPVRSTMNMMFGVRMLHKIERKEGVSLFMWFVHLQKAYDTIDRTLLWQVRTRMGVPPQIIAVIRQYHAGMGACMQPDGGVCSNRFKVEQRLRQGSELSPLL